MCGTTPASTEMSSHVASFLDKPRAKAGTRGEALTTVIANGDMSSFLGLLFFTVLNVLSFRGLQACL